MTFQLVAVPQQTTLPRAPMHIGYWWEIQKRPLIRPRRTRADNIKMGLRETGWDGMHWIVLAQDRD
jgi:hypothetical protein